MPHVYFIDTPTKETYYLYSFIVMPVRPATDHQVGGSSSSKTCAQASTGNAWQSHSDCHDKEEGKGRLQDPYHGAMRQRFPMSTIRHTHLSIRNK